MKLTQDEKKWQAESDAETMARYEEILADKSRMAAAVKVAKERAVDLTKKADTMKKVANAKTSKTKKK